MKCINCGWDNAEGSVSCEKCNSDLMSAQAGASFGSFGEEEYASISPKPRRDYSSIVPVSCSRCGYPMSPRMEKCPNCDSLAGVSQKGVGSKQCPSCGALIDADDNFCRRCGEAVDEESIKKRKIQKTGLGTFFDGPTKGASFFTLRPLPSKGEVASFAPVSYSGSSVVLNRANTEATNRTISAREQARMIFDDGRWYIENQSGMHTSFLRLNRRLELKDGDILIFGNRAFEFKH